MEGRVSLQGRCRAGSHRAGVEHHTVFSVAHHPAGVALDTHDVAGSVGTKLAAVDSIFPHLHDTAHSQIRRVIDRGVAGIRVHIGQTHHAVRRGLGGRGLYIAGSGKALHRSRTRIAPQTAGRDLAQYTAAQRGGEAACAEVGGAPTELAAGLARGQVDPDLVGTLVTIDIAHQHLGAGRGPGRIGLGPNLHAGKVALRLPAPVGTPQRGIGLAPEDLVSHAIAIEIGRWQHGIGTGFERASSRAKTYRGLLDVASTVEYRTHQIALAVAVHIAQLGWQHIGQLRQPLRSDLGNGVYTRMGVWQIIPLALCITQLDMTVVLTPHTSIVRLTRRPVGVAHRLAAAPDEIALLGRIVDTHPVVGGRAEGAPDPVLLRRIVDCDQVATVGACPCLALVPGHCRAADQVVMAVSRVAHDTALVAAERHRAALAGALHQRTTRGLHQHPLRLETRRAHYRTREEHISRLVAIHITHRSKAVVAPRPSKQGCRNSCSKRAIGLALGEAHRPGRIPPHKVVSFVCINVGHEHAHARVVGRCVAPVADVLLDEGGLHIGVALPPRYPQRAVRVTEYRVGVAVTIDIAQESLAVGVHVVPLGRVTAHPRTIGIDQQHREPPIAQIHDGIFASIPVEVLVALCVAQFGLVNVLEVCRHTAGAEVVQLTVAAPGLCQHHPQIGGAVTPRRILHTIAVDVQIELQGQVDGGTRPAKVAKAPIRLAQLEVTPTPHEIDPSVSIDVPIVYLTSRVRRARISAAIGCLEGIAVAAVCVFQRDIHPVAASAPDRVLPPVTVEVGSKTLARHLLGRHARPAIHPEEVAVGLAQRHEALVDGAVPPHVDQRIRTPVAVDVEDGQRIPEIVGPCLVVPVHIAVNGSAKLVCSIVELDVAAIKHQVAIPVAIDIEEGELAQGTEVSGTVAKHHPVAASTNRHHAITRQNQVQHAVAIDIPIAVLPRPVAPHRPLQVARPGFSVKTSAVVDVALDVALRAPQQVQITVVINIDQPLL